MSAESTPERPRNASPARSFRSRMGTMLRRNSSGFTMPRPSIPFRSESKSSLKVDSTALAPPSAPESHTAPSPVAESPAREAAETNGLPQPAAPIGPSPLAQETTSSPQPATAPLAQDSEAAQPPAEAPVVPEAVSEPVAIAVAPVTIPVSSPEPVPAPAQAPSEEAPAPAVTEEPKSYYGEVDHANTFAWRDPVPSTPSRSVSPRQSSGSLRKSSSRDAIVASPEMLSSNISRKGSKSSLASSFGHVVVEAGGRRVSVSVPDDTSYEEPRRGRSRASSIRVSFKNKFEDPYTDPFADPPESTAAPRVLSPIDSVAEPQSAVTAKMPSPQEYPSSEATPMPPTSMPLPQHERSEPMYVLQPPPETLQTQDFKHQTYSPTPIVMSQPPPESVMNTRVQKMPSAYSLGEQAAPSTTDQHHPLETDERLPLLNRGYDASKASLAQPSTSKAAVSFPSARAFWPTAAQSFHALGWSEILLPDSSVYYVNRSMRVTVDVDLRNSKKLEAVTEYLDRKLPEEVALPPLGWELWLKEADETKKGFVPVRNWVNHEARSLSFKPPPPAMNGEAITAADHVTDDDRMDSEYRYWSFIESHPAHTPLPPNAHQEALDALKWTYTDSLLPTEQQFPPPFTPAECQELMGLLRSFDSEMEATSVVHTRLVSRILIRLVQWRQQHFRPDRALPTDMMKNHQRNDRTHTLRRYFLDVIMSLLCLGIPYLFLGRASNTSYHRLDVEDGGTGARNPGPMVMVGAIACLVSALILSASVTFMTLPGLDDVARLAGLIAILFSASSMVSSVVALFRWKADVERTVVYVGGEGLTLLTKRSIVMSLPLVFLAWAVAAFITAITFYSFRGATVTSRVVIRQPFEDYTHWAVVGTLGGLVGILVMAFIWIHDPVPACLYLITISTAAPLY
ncbi:hypothetical protein EIP91_001962 [Steccherinum ochraceum]|uniref:Uncharacterized protein n=1 Tax=Steccherinum ochraceum TaxID=92696 RepID=A0A4R0RCZ9_9APHY|nr:hypothetical protein EIP91_001962 [Steccherinum ochraceum]